MTEIEFNEMVKSNSGELKRHAMKFTNDIDDANDLVQDTLFKAIRYREKYQEGTNLKGWLFTIMRNTFINNYRHNTKTNTLIIKREEISSENLTYSATVNQAVGGFVLNDINTALMQLPDHYRDPFVRYFEGYKYHEIAEDLNMPIGTVKTRIHMAREMLKKHLKTYSKDNSNNPIGG